jgi:ketosteroid isomerase-like protein
MSQENVEIVRAIYRAWQVGDFEAALARFDEDVEWFGPPDVTDTFGRGHEGVRTALATWVGTWDEYHFELRELIDAGDQVLATGWQRGRGKGSGVEVSEEIFSVWTLDAGSVVRQRMFRDRIQSLEAAGLSE